MRQSERSFINCYEIQCTNNTHKVGGDIGNATGTPSDTDVRKHPFPAKARNLQSNVIIGKSCIGKGLTLINTNIASSTLSHFLMIRTPAPMGCNERKYEGDKDPDSRDPAKHADRIVS